MPPKSIPGLRDTIKMSGERFFAIVLGHNQVIIALIDVKMLFTKKYFCFENKLNRCAIEFLLVDRSHFSVIIFSRTEKRYVEVNDDCYVLYLK